MKFFLALLFSIGAPARADGIPACANLANKPLLPVGTECLSRRGTLFRLASRLPDGNANENLWQDANTGLLWGKDVEPIGDAEIYAPEAVAECQAMPERPGASPDEKIISWLPSLADFTTAFQHGFGDIAPALQTPFEQARSFWSSNLDLSQESPLPLSAGIFNYFPNTQDDKMLPASLHIIHGSFYTCVSAALKNCASLDPATAPEQTRCRTSKNNGVARLRARNHKGHSVWQDLQSGFLWTEALPPQTPAKALETCISLSNGEWAFMLPVANDPPVSSPAGTTWHWPANQASAARNGIFDLFPPSASRQFLIHLAGHEVSIGPSNQRFSLYDLDSPSHIVAADLTKPYSFRCFGWNKFEHGK